MQNLIIRRAIELDAKTLSECIDAAYAVYLDRIDDLPAVSEGIVDDIGKHRVWVAELDQVVVGGLILVLHDRFAVMSNVAVSPSSSGLGLGRALIDHAERDCRELGLQELRLTTHVEMPENIGIYEHLGWTETGRTGSKVYMTKHLCS